MSEDKPAYKRLSAAEIEQLRLMLVDVDENIGPAAIAERLGRSEGAVRVRVRRCLRSNDGWPHIKGGAAAWRSK